METLNEIEKHDAEIGLDLLICAPKNTLAMPQSASPSVRTIPIPDHSAWLGEATALAQLYIEDPVVKHYLRAYDCGSALDPLLAWSVVRYPCANKLMVFNDWGVETDDSGTVEANIDYVAACFETDPGWDDKTYSNLFHTDWSRKEISSGQWWLMNSVWGMRRRHWATNNENEKIPAAVHLRALPVWLSAAQRIRPVTVYLCGRWVDYVWEQAQARLREAKLEVLCHPSSRGKTWWKNKDHLSGY